MVIVPDGTLPPLPSRRPRRGEVAGWSPFLWSDNTATVGFIQKHASKSESHMAEDRPDPVPPRRVRRPQPPSLPPEPIVAPPRRAPRPPRPSGPITIPPEASDPRVSQLRPHLDRLTASDSHQQDADGPLQTPAAAAQGKSQNRARSLLQPQDLAQRLLPRELYAQLMSFSRGVPAECGADWPEKVIRTAARAGPHVSALTDENVELIWDDIAYQEAAGFVQIVREALLLDTMPANLKISRVAVVPQAHRRGRIIVNLSARVTLSEKTRRRPAVEHPSVNEASADAEDQSGVAALGDAMHSILRFMFETNCEWEIDWQKIDLSDGFWRMIVESGAEYNFAWQLPKRPEDHETMYVIPSALQMGWKNSPAYFCVATEATRTLIKRILALTFDTGIDTPHRHESHCVDAPVGTEDPWFAPEVLEILSRVFVDDFMHGVAGPVGRKYKRAELEWVARAALHAIHSIFPPPDVLEHQGGKDSVSEKKLLKGDARFARDKVLLGALAQGGPGAGRTICVPQDKRDRYCDKLREALDKRHPVISFADFRRIHGQLQHIALFIPWLRAFMTPLNRQLKRVDQPVGLGKKSRTRRAFEYGLALMEANRDRPTHIAEIVPPSLPHVYGTTDAAAVGAGGVWLPCTRWVQPTVWRFQFPADIDQAVRDDELTMADCESAANFIGECLLDDILCGGVAGLSSFLWSDNTPTVGRIQKQASKGKSHMAEDMLLLMALRQRISRRGPQDCLHWKGTENDLGDIPSRSFEEGFPDHADAAFLAHFAHKFPLPPQLGSWRLVRPRAAITSVACSLLRGTLGMTSQPTTLTGARGASSPMSTASTLTSSSGKDQIDHWNDITCSFPLLDPSGRVNTTVDGRLRQRRSRKHYENAPRSWSPQDLRTLARQIRDPAA